MNELDDETALSLEITRLKQELQEAREDAERPADGVRHLKWCRYCSEDGLQSCQEGQSALAAVEQHEAMTAKHQ